MFTWYGSYPEACALVMGYSIGVGGAILDGFQQWLGARHGGRSELAFWVHVLTEAFPGEGITQASGLSEEQHRVAVDKLFELLEDYLADGDSA